MNQMVKSILIKCVISGSGIVNFDSNNQKWLWNKQRDVEPVRKEHNNVSFGKGRYYKSGDNLEKVPVISADCIRHTMFEDNMFIHLPNIMHDDELLLKAVANPAFIERGYLFARGGKTIWKRKSAFAIGYAKAINTSASYLEIYSNSQEKTHLEKSEETGETSLFKREVRGDTIYELTGFIDIGELGFISLSEVHDRLSFDLDYESKFNSYLSSKIGEVPAATFHLKNGDVYEIPEFGIKLTDEQTKNLVTDILKRLARFNITRTVSGNARTVKLEIKPVIDPLVDLIDEEDGWTTIFDGKKFTSDIINSINLEEIYKKVDLKEEALEKISSYKKKFGYKKVTKSKNSKKSDINSEDISED